MGKKDVAGHPGCIVCGSFKLSELAYARLLACDECGTLTREPEVSTRAASESHSHDAHPRRDEAGFEERMPELVRWVGPNARVLEVGSTGFLAAARRPGWRAEGVDVQTGSLEERCFPSRRFDAVFVWSCFDRLPEPWEQLREIHRILDDSGRLLIRVPNGEFVKRVSRLERWAPSENVREGLRRILALSGLAGFPYQVGYTPGSLTRMLRDSGFESVSVRNPINMRGLVEGRDGNALRCVHAASRLVRHATFGTVNWGPWIEISCSKSPLTFAQNELPLLCVA